MKLLERSFTVYSKGEKKRNTDDMFNETFGIADEAAVDPRRPPLMKRPHTSAGIDNRHSSLLTGLEKSRDIVKSPTCSRDLQTSGKVVEITDGLDTFRFPTPSPQKAPRSATFQYSPSPFYSSRDDSSGIGIAIGSPSHAPPNWGRSFTSDRVVTLNHLPPGRPPPSPPRRTQTVQNAPENRKRKTSWKPFGALFRRTSKHASEKSFDMGRSEARSRTPLKGTPDSLQRKDKSNPSDWRFPLPASSEQHTCPPQGCGIDHKHDSRDQSARTPHVSVNLDLKTSTLATRTVPPRKLMNLALFEPRDRPGSPLKQDDVNVEAKPMPTPRTPKLMLELPSTEFDRYSVMFEKLLTNDPRPSLLERRQSKLPGKWSGQEDAGQMLGVAVPEFPAVPRRSLSSPQLTSRLSIRVDSSQTSVSLIGVKSSPGARLSKPLQRSNTAPPGSASPMKAIFAHERKSTGDSLPGSSHSTLYSENSLPPTPTSATTYTDVDSIHQGPEQYEPVWEMMTPQPAMALLPKSESKKPCPRVKSPESLERQRVQVSIAREVSVTRTRTRVQQAMETKQPLRPRVVELTKNRKSTVGVLESAGEEAEVEPVPEKQPVLLDP